jgi:hypothetical protein
LRGAAERSSATINITASGAWVTLPKQAIMPTTTNGAGEWATAGRSCASRQTAAPRKPPMTIPGPKIRPDPPDPMDSDVATIFANGSTRITLSGTVRTAAVMATWTHP